MELPTQTFYHMPSLTCRALELWRLDDSLSLALEVGAVFRRVFDWYQQIWPCAGAFHLIYSAGCAISRGMLWLLSEPSQSSNGGRRMHSASLMPFVEQ